MVKSRDERNSLCKSTEALRQELPFPGDSQGIHSLVSWRSSLNTILQDSRTPQSQTGLEPIHWGNWGGQQDKETCQSNKTSRQTLDWKVRYRKPQLISPQPHPCHLCGHLPSCSESASSHWPPEVTYWGQKACSYTGNQEQKQTCGWGPGQGPHATVPFFL